MQSYPSLAACFNIVHGEDAKQPTSVAQMQLGWIGGSAGLRAIPFLFFKSAC
jgi:hypothetical protein